jgi:hypothetical protein
MKKRVLGSIMRLTGIAVALSVIVLIATVVQRQSSAQSQDVKPTKQKKLIEIAEERDLEVVGSSGSHVGYITLASLRTGAMAIVYGRIIDSNSFFDPSGHPIEYGENITTEYTVDVLRVLKDRTLDTTPAPGKAAPAPLSTPLKIARNGGVVYVNGHRASVKVKGFEALEPGKQYVFFLSWSPDYKAYTLIYGIAGAVMVNDDMSLKPLASSKELHAELHGINLESFFNQLR